jgi:hypothetical protein
MQATLPAAARDDKLHRRRSGSIEMIATDLNSEHALQRMRHVRPQLIRIKDET